MTSKTLVERLEELAISVECDTYTHEEVALIREAMDRITTLEALATAQPAEAVERARKLYEPDEYEDAFKGRTCNDAAQGAVAEVVGFDRGLPDLEWVNTSPLAKGDKLYLHPTPDTTAAELLADDIQKYADESKRTDGGVGYELLEEWAERLRTLAGKMGGKP